MDDIISHIGRFDPAAAGLVAERISAAAASLRDFPHRGRPASRDARELTHVPPYVLRYRVVNDTVLIVRVRHGRRRPLR